MKKEVVKDFIMLDLVYWCLQTAEVATSDFHEIMLKFHFCWISFIWVFTSSLDPSQPCSECQKADVDALQKWSSGLPVAPRSQRERRIHSPASFPLGLCFFSHQHSGPIRYLSARSSLSLGSCNCCFSSFLQALPCWEHCYGLNCAPQIHMLKS